MYFAQVRLVRTGQGHRPSARSGPLLATFVGADFSIRNTDGAWSVWCLEVLHATATDVEHDDAKVARMIVANPVIMATVDGMVEYAGTLTDARLYPPGTDPLTVADVDTTPGVCAARRRRQAGRHPTLHPIHPITDGNTCVVPPDRITGSHRWPRDRDLMNHLNSRDRRYPWPSAASRAPIDAPDHGVSPRNDPSGRGSSLSAPAGGPRGCRVPSPTSPTARPPWM